MPSYSSGLLRSRVTILKKEVAETFGATTQYVAAATVWAGVAWSKGVKSLREGVLDAYDTILVRMRYTDTIDRDSRLRYDGRTYQVQSLNRDYQENILQITATEIIGE